jgi:hypothetical protein
MHAAPGDREELLQIVAAICALPPREAGGEGERMAQELLAGRVAPLGFDALVDGVVCPPRQPAVLVLHGGALLLAAMLAPPFPVLSAVLSVWAGVSFWGELRGGPYLLRGLLLRRISGNLVARRRARPRDVISTEAARSRPAFVLTAHADTGSVGRLLPPLRRRFFDRPAGRSIYLHPGVLVLLAASVQVGTALAWALGLRGTAPLAALLSCCIVHAGALLFAADAWRAPPSPGAVDNASGLAVLAGFARRVFRKPPVHLDVFLVASGDREPEAGGIDAWLEQSGGLLDPAQTWFVNVDDLASGPLCAGTQEGRWERLAYHPALPALAERVGADLGVPVRLAELPGRTDAGPPTERGFRAVTLRAIDDACRRRIHTVRDTPDGVDGDMLCLALDLVEGMFRALDAEAGRLRPPSDRAG